MAMDRKTALAARGQYNTAYKRARLRKMQESKRGAPGNQKLTPKAERKLIAKSMKKEGFWWE